MKNKVEIGELLFYLGVAAMIAFAVYAYISLAGGA